MEEAKCEDLQWRCNFASANGNDDLGAGRHLESGRLQAAAGAHGVSLTRLGLQSQIGAVCGWGGLQ
jgi:hypothetical protein